MADLPSLFPPLPPDLSLHIISLLPRSSLPPLRSVSRSFRTVLDSAELALSRRFLGNSETFVHVIGKSMGRQRLLALNLQTDTWHTLADLPYRTLSPLGGGALEDCPLHGFEFVSSDLELVLLGGYQTMSVQAYTANIGHVASSGETATWQKEQLVVAGGVWRYNPYSNNWKKGAQMGSKSRSFFASGFMDNKIYVAGGLATDNSPLTSSEVYDLGKDEWTPLPPLPATENFLRSTKRLTGAVVQGKLYVLGVCPTQGGLLSLLGIFDPRTASWTTPHVSPCLRPLSDHNPQKWTSGGGGLLGVQSVVSGNRIFFMRGLLDDYQGWGDRELREYDVVSNDWSVVSCVPGPKGSLGREWQVIRQAFSLAVSGKPAGEILVVGGVAWARLFGRLDVQSVQMYGPTGGGERGKERGSGEGSVVGGEREGGRESEGGREEEREEEREGEGDKGNWRSVGFYEAELFLGVVWKCATVEL